ELGVGARPDASVRARRADPRWRHPVDGYPARSLPEGVANAGGGAPRRRAARTAFGRNDRRLPERDRSLAAGRGTDRARDRAAGARVARGDAPGVAGDHEPAARTAEEAGLHGCGVRGPVAEPAPRGSAA